MEGFQGVWTVVALTVVVLMLVALTVVPLMVVALHIVIAIVQYHKWVKRKAGVLFGLII